MKLLNTVLENKALFQLTDDETKELVTRYWLDFKEACSDSHDDAVNKTLNSALKLICDHKSTDEWIELLTEVEKVICTLLLLSGKNIIKIMYVSYLLGNSSIHFFGQVQATKPNIGVNGEMPV